jgi:hypothetical protein
VALKIERMEIDDAGANPKKLAESIVKLRIPTYPAGRSDKIRSVIPGYPAT